MVFVRIRKSFPSKMMDHIGGHAYMIEVGGMPLQGCLRYSDCYNTAARDYPWSITAFKACSTMYCIVISIVRVALYPFICFFQHQGQFHPCIHFSTILPCFCQHFIKSNSTPHTSPWSSTCGLNMGGNN